MGASVSYLKKFENNVKVQARFGVMELWWKNLVIVASNFLYVIDTFYYEFII